MENNASIRATPGGFDDFIVPPKLGAMIGKRFLIGLDLKFMSSLKSTARILNPCFLQSLTTPGKSVGCRAKISANSLLRNLPLTQSLFHPFRRRTTRINVNGILIEYEGEDSGIGLLFASKAAVQVMLNI